MRVVFVTDNGFCQKEGVYYYSGANIQHYNTIRQHFDEIIYVARNSRFAPSYNVIDEAYECVLLMEISQRGLCVCTLFSIG